jgi:hypothetical protein
LPTPPPRTVIVLARASTATTLAFAYVRVPGVVDRSGVKAACASAATAPDRASRAQTPALTVFVHTFHVMTPPSPFYSA